MRSVPIAVALALFLTAVGLLLWQWAKRRQAQEVAGKHLAQQILAKDKETSAIAVAPDLQKTGSAPNSFITGLTSDPWSTIDAPEGSSRQSRHGIALPGWLLGVIEPKHAAIAFLATLALSMATGLWGGLLAGTSALVALLILAGFGLWLRLQKFRKALVGQLPPFIDAMVRLITIGNSTQASFQLAIASAKEPLRVHLEHAAALVRAGVDLDRALHQTASNVRIEEMYLLASILGLGVRYGGRADLLLERVANFMRDREQAEHELVAMSAETRLSAWILGLLPIGVGAFLIATNPSYFMRMWNDETGRMLIFSAAGLQLIGVGLLYRLSRLT